MSSKPWFIHLAILNLALFAAPAAPLGSAFTYQGQVQQSNNPVNALCDFQFSLWDSPVGGSFIGTTQAVNGVSVSNGLFTVPLDFGPGVFNGEARWLEIDLRTPAGAGPFSQLDPRQLLTATPYALQAVSAAQVAATNLVGLLSNSQLPTNVSHLDYNQLFTGSNIFSGANVMTNASNQFAGSFSGVFTGAFFGDGSGLTNLPVASGSSNQVMAWTPLGAPATAVANNGYLANGPNLVAITLPAAPTLGDIFRVAGAGVGGWQLLQGASDQVILTRPLGCAGGLNWVSNGPPAGWRGLASSADGKRVVAVAQDPLLGYSTNAGRTWTTNTNPYILWQAVASSADGMKLVAGGSTSGSIWTTADGGATWVEHPRGESWTGFASSADGINLIAVSLGGYIYNSTDSGATWARHAASNYWTSVACSTDGTRAIAGPYYGPLYVSVNSGVTWVPHGPTNYWSAVASSADGSHLLATDRGNGGSGGQIYLSDDFGVTWAATGPTRAWAGVASSADASRLFAVDDGNSAGGQIYTSVDYGMTWTGHGPIQPWHCITCSADGVQVVAAASWVFTGNPINGPIYSSAGTTSPGPSGGLMGGPDEAVELLFIGNNQFRVLSHEGTISAF